MNGFALKESENSLIHSHHLRNTAHKMHLNSAQLRVIDRPVLKILQVKFRIHLAVKALEKIQVKGRSYSLRIIVGALKDLMIFLEISSDQNSSSMAD